MRDEPGALTALRLEALESDYTHSLPADVAVGGEGCIQDDQLASFSQSILMLQFSSDVFS